MLTLRYDRLMASELVLSCLHLSLSNFSHSPPFALSIKQFGSGVIVIGVRFVVRTTKLDNIAATPAFTCIIPNRKPVTNTKSKISSSIYVLVVVVVPSLIAVNEVSKPLITTTLQIQDSKPLLYSPHSFDTFSVPSIQLIPLAPEFSLKFQHTLYLKCENYRNQKRQHYEINGILKIKNGECAACLKYSVSIFVE